MPEDDVEYTDDPIEDDGEGSPKWYRKQMAADKKALAASQAEATAGRDALRKLAFIEAGVPDTPQTAFFRKHYDGEPSADAVKAAAMEHGFLSDQTAETKAEIQVIEDQFAASNGGDLPIIPGTHDEFIRGMDDAANAAAGGGESQAIAAYMTRHGIEIGDS